MTIEKRIDRVISKINSNPLIYHRETDIHAMIFSELCKEYTKSVKTKLGYTTGLVHCEYFGGDGTRIDIVVLNKDDAETIERHTMEKGCVPGNNNKSHIKLDVAIEVKTNLGRQSRRKEMEGLTKDIEKLKKQRDKNPEVELFLLYFIRYHSKTNNKKSSAKKQEILENVDEIRKKCEEEKIIFKTNDDYFLEKQKI